MFIPVGCVFDGIDGKNCDDSLNTEMTITIEDQKISVKVCDKCADDATAKIVKEAYLKKKNELDAVIAQAKKLGLNINLPTSSNIVTATQPTRPQPIRQEPQQRQASQLDTVDEDFIELDTITSVINKNNNLKSASSVPGGMSEHRINDQGMLKGKAKVELLEGRNGTPLVVPVVKQDMTGTTRINIRQSIDDQGLQKRFKDMADKSQREDVCFGQNGYTGVGGVRDCPICYGLGVTKNRGQQITCPRCAGSGIMTD